LRADARDNRARILAAADEVFGASGETASTEDVARLADVGIATVFRHFPTKRDLLHAVFSARLEALRDRARELASAPDPGAAPGDETVAQGDGGRRDDRVEHADGITVAVLDDRR